ncbi:tyrosine phosphatase [Cordyceps militaris]|uniref:Very-long-chain (3R)-3-hydroxyacyl-CoA dehydratase n=1 Tax=Cordyceps militaris TaxID=73501 RepID=A0A2H4SNI5_CORMI|nr:tyrosine phosphatase [Cordyceps militaris]
MAPSSPLRTGYLVLYNALSCVAWAVVLYRTVTSCLTVGYPYTYLEVGEWTRWTQTAACLEVLHSLFGIVRAPIATTVMQVMSRLLLVWGITYPFPFVTQAPFYASMLVAWSVTEVIRYSYFATSLAGLQPSFLTFLRYNTFFILYPLGIFSECSLIFITSKFLQGAEQYMLYAILAIYIPGSYTLYTYMMKQRSKVFGGAQNAKKTQ